ncbi:MAG: N-acetylneuraminate synthase family protein [Solirubrobacterales bacterium]
MQGGWCQEQHELGFNYRLSDIHSALGRSQLARLDAFVAARNAIATRYREALADVGALTPGPAAPSGKPACFDIGGRTVGAGAPAYVIAEIGANHNRDLDVARRLIDAAVAAGADAVKFQTYDGNRIYSRKTPKFSCLENISDKSPADLLDEIALPREWQPILAEEARARGIAFFSSPFDHEAVDELDAIDVPVLKIASFEIVDLPLIRKAASTGRPLMISTGMARLGEVEEALEAAREAGAPAVGLMQCTSVYPAPPERAKLAAMATMRAAFRVPVGLSDHTTGIAVPIASAALGAAFVEKHLTLDRQMPGPDHSFAVEPRTLKEMVAGIREAQAAIGDGIKDGPSPEESGEMYRLGRRSLILTCPLRAGTALSRDMLTVKRPGYGVAPRDLELVIGRTLRQDVEEDDVLTGEMV